jgi:hypothetical protein
MPTMPRVEMRWSLLGSHPQSAAVYMAAPFVICALVVVAVPERRLAAVALLVATAITVLLIQAVLRRWERRLSASRGAGSHALAQFDLRSVLTTSQDERVLAAVRRGRGFVAALLSLTAAGVTITPTPTNVRLGVAGTMIPWADVQAITLSPMLLGLGAWGVVLHLSNGPQIRCNVLRGRAFSHDLRRAITLRR